MSTSTQVHQRAPSDDALLQAVSDLFIAARVTVDNASRAVTDAQNALLSARAWLASAQVASETYRLEYLRIKDTVAGRCPLLEAKAVTIPDEIVVIIAQLCVKEARERLEWMGEKGGLWNTMRDRRRTAWVYPIAISQVCRRWRGAVLRNPKLWSYMDNFSSTVSPRLAKLIRLRSGSRTLGVLWSVLPTPLPKVRRELAHYKRWGSLRLIHSITSENNPPAIPFGPIAHFGSLLSLVITAPPQKGPPVFSTTHLSSMPKLTKLVLHNVQFLAPPPYRHPNRMDFSIHYTSIISFRDRDMADIAIVFPNLQSFSLHIRGPYVNRHRRFISDASHSEPLPDPPLKLPFNFHALESLDISARDLTHSLTRFQGAFLPRLKTLRLRENGLPAASTFFYHVARSRAPIYTLALSDYSPSATKAFRMYRGIRVLEMPFNLAALEILQPVTAETSAAEPATSPIMSPSSLKRKASMAPPLAFPSVTTLMLSSHVESGSMEGSIGRFERTVLNGLAEIVKSRNAVVLETYGTKGLRSLPSISAMMSEMGKEVIVEYPMTSAETLVRSPTPGSLSRKSSFSGCSSHSTTKRRGGGGLAMSPLLDVQFSPIRGVAPKPSSCRGRVAMDRVYYALVDGRKAWTQMESPRIQSPC